MSKTSRPWLCEHEEYPMQLRFEADDQGIVVRATCPDLGNGSTDIEWELTDEQAGDLADWLAPFLDQMKHDEKQAQIDRINAHRAKG